MDRLEQQGVMLDIENIEWLVTHPGDYDPETDTTNPTSLHEAKAIVLALCQVARILARLTWDYESIHGIRTLERLVKEEELK